MPQALRCVVTCQAFSPDARATIACEFKQAADYPLPPTGVESLACTARAMQDSEQEVIMKCAHPGCKCDANDQWGIYCSEHCQKEAQHVESRCTCGHPDCHK